MAFVGYPSSTGARQGAAAGGAMIYFDNAATSWSKPPGVAEAMTHFIKEVGCPGRKCISVRMRIAQEVLPFRVIGVDRRNPGWMTFFGQDRL